MVERKIGMGNEVLDYGRKIIIRYQVILISPSKIIMYSSLLFLE